MEVAITATLGQQARNALVSYPALWMLCIDVNGGTVHPVRLKRGLVWGEIPMYGVAGAAAAAPALLDRVRRGQDRD